MTKLARDKISLGAFEVPHSKATAYWNTLSPLSIPKEEGMMPADYEEVLRDLELRESRLMADLNTIRNAKPAIAALIRAQQVENSMLSPSKGKYVGMGATKAIQALLVDGDLLTRDQIYSRLVSEGWTSDSKDPLSTISATLSQMKDVSLERVEDRWRKKTSGSSLVSSQDIAEYGTNDTTASVAPVNSRVSLIYDHPSSIAALKRLQR